MKQQQLEDFIRRWQLWARLASNGACDLSEAAVVRRQLQEFDREAERVLRPRDPAAVTSCRHTNQKVNLTCRTVVCEDCGWSGGFWP